MFTRLGAPLGTPWLWQPRTRKKRSAEAAEAWLGFAREALGDLDSLESSREDLDELELECLEAESLCTSKRTNRHKSMHCIYIIVCDYQCSCA